MTALPSSILLVAAAAVGLLAGIFLNRMAHRLPALLLRHWCEDAHDLLEKGDGLGSNDSGARTLPARLVVTASMLLTLVTVQHFGLSMATALLLIFTWSLLALAVIDMNTGLLPDVITQPLLWLGLLANVQALFAPLVDAVIGAAAGYLLLWLVYWVFKLLTGREGMGRGDFKLLAALGAWLGWQMLPFIIVLASAAGMVMGLAGILLLGRDRRQAIAFGPHLAAAGWIALLWGREIATIFYMAT